jgi:allantoinase
MIDLVIRNGTVVTPDGVMSADIAVEDGIIAAIAPELPGGTRDIDAEGLLVLPGLIDIHVHFNEPGRTDWEGAATGSRALAAGGGVMFFDMPLNSSPCTVSAAAFDEKRAALERSSIADFALWGGLIPGSVDAMEEMAARGAIGFKAFLSNSGLDEFPRADDLTLYRGMQTAARLGLPVAVHAENEEITAGLARQAIAEGRTGIRDYLQSRPIVAEVEAITRAAAIARETGAKLHIVHVSSGSGVAAALEARAHGTDISIETCAHYLFFTEDDACRLGAVAKCAPPLRPASERDALWECLRAGSIDVVASDHSPAPPSMKTGADFFSVWGGIAGVQCTLPVLLASVEQAFGLLVAGRRPAPPEQIAGLTAGFAAQRFQLPNKGAIQTGNDADFVFVDLAASATLTMGHLYQRHKQTPYLGASFRGVVRRTLLRGQTIFHDGAIADGHRGRFVRPALPIYATSTYAKSWTNT